MDTTTTQDALSLFFVAAESEECNNYDVLAYATTAEHAIEIWSKYWEHEAEDYAWMMTTGDVSVGVVAGSEVLVQSSIEPGVAEWTIRQQFSTSTLSE